MNTPDAGPQGQVKGMWAEFRGGSKEWERAALSPRVTLRSP